MIDRTRNLLLLGLLVIGLPGCAWRGQSPSPARWPGSQHGANVPSPGWNGPQVQPGTGLQPTPAMKPPVIEPGPALPDASGHRYQPYPESTGTRRRYPPRGLAPVIPRTRQPIASDPSTPGGPAELSGEIEIIPGPTLRARKARMEMLPSPEEDAE